MAPYMYPVQPGTLAPADQCEEFANRSAGQVVRRSAELGAGRASNAIDATCAT